MSILNSVEIKNFRGFDELSINNFSKINLFIGNNNSGKSSILEAIFLLVGMSNPNLPEVISQFRGTKVKDGDGFRYLFHNLNINNNPEFKCILSDNSDRSLRLNPIFKKRGNSDSQNILMTSNEGSIDASTSGSKISGLELEFSTKKRHDQRKSFKSSIQFEASGISQKINTKHKEELHGILISSDAKEGQVLARFSEIVKKKKGDSILKLIQQFDSNIESIQPLPDGLFFSYKNIDELIPISIVGDGIKKYMNIITTISERIGSIVLIDEIENGLHYSAHKLLWKSIISISKEFNAQLFITTHNSETLKCLKEVIELSEFETIQNDLSIYNVSHTSKSGIKTYKYSYTGLKDAIETNTEIR